jgi:hypothetical protein
MIEMVTVIIVVREVTVMIITHRHMQQTVREHVDEALQYVVIEAQITIELVQHANTEDDVCLMKERPVIVTDVEVIELFNVTEAVVNELHKYVQTVTQTTI